jgi:LmbE family N-acetylglucosaminyl deacetylase
LLFVFAHPDDESEATGGTIARHTHAGVEVHLVCLTRGGAGWRGRPPGRKPEELPAIRAAELEAAARELGIASVALWDYPDGAVPACDQDEITRRILERAKALRPAAVVCWGPDGGYFHPDHIACGACTDEAVAGSGIPLYHLAVTAAIAQGYRRLVDLSGQDGAGLPMVVWERTSVTVKINAAEMAVKKRAIAAHVSQMDAGWDMFNAGQIGVDGLDQEGFVRVRDTNPAGLLLEHGLFPELSLNATMETQR